MKKEVRKKSSFEGKSGKVEMKEPTHKRRSKIINKSWKIKNERKIRMDNRDKENR